jgi:hypothetical protein
MQLYPVRVCVVLVLGAIRVLSACVIAEETSGVAGTWRGESACVTDAAACHNEKVVYHIKAVPNRSDVVLIQADKIVDGKAITMGTGQWQHDRVRQTLEWSMPQQVWLLKITGSRIEGTLRLADGTVLRKMTLDKDK